MSFPTVVTTLDGFTGGDGPPGGDWSATSAFSGSGLALVVSGGYLTYPGSGADNGFLQTSYGPDVELQAPVKSDYVVRDGDAFVFGARGTDMGTTGWGGVYVLVVGGVSNDTWYIKDRIEGTTTQLATSSSDRLRPDLGDVVGLEIVGTTVNAYKINGGTATLVTTGTTSVADAGEFFFELAPVTGSFDGLGPLVGGTKVPEGNIIYVSPDGDDSNTYEEAQSPTTPMETFEGALSVVQSGDKVRMIDGVTDGFQWPQVVALSPILVDFVTVEGWNAVLGDSASWHVRNLHLRGVDRWTFRNQVTYGETQGDLSELDACSNMTFVNWEAQRGGANILSALGDWLWDGGSVTAPLDGPALSFLDGVGWRIFNAFETTIGIGNVEFRDHEFFNVQGEDGCQFLGGTTGHSGLLKFSHCYWHDFVQSDQPNSPHTDGVQTIGANHVVFDSCWFKNVASMIISTDDYVQQMDLINCAFDGNGHGGYSTQFFGLFGLKAVNCTWNGSGFGGLRVGYDSRLATTNPVDGGNEHLVIQIKNCIIDALGYTEGIDDPDNDQAATITPSHNRIAIGPIGDTDTQGFAEYGHTGSGDDVVRLELANTPSGTNSAIIDAGLSHADDADVPLLDRLGRTRKGSGTDIGSNESDPDVDVTVDTRDIRFVSSTPASGDVDVSSTATWEFVLSPTPGQAIDPETVTDDTVFIADVGYGVKLPILSRTIGDPDDDGSQTVTVTVDYQGRHLDPAVSFVATITTGLTDTQSSALTVDKTWTSLSAGRGGPALTPVDDGGGGGGDLVGGWVVGVA